MRLIPVLDILGGQVVHAVAGRRNEYRPVTSRWTRSCQPIDVARALHDAYGFREFYIADLNGILHGRPNREIIGLLVGLGFRLWLDAGFRNVQQVGQWLAEIPCQPVLGLETFTLEDAHCGQDDAVLEKLATRPALLSLDSRAGQLLVAEPCWRSWSVAKVVQWWYERGWRHFLALDLAAVGTGQLHWSLQLLHAAQTAAQISSERRKSSVLVYWYLGGGVRCLDDLHLLAGRNIDGVLLASALHAGRILPHHLSSFVQV